jgi:phosphopantetheine adenylyltransferase
MNKKEIKEIKEIKERLNYLRREIEKEQISYSEIVELQDLKDYIEDNDVLLKEWAGIPEGK